MAKITLDKFMEDAPAVLEAFRLAHSAENAKNPKDFPMEFDEEMWWRQVGAYVLYIDVVGDLPQDMLKALNLDAEIGENNQD